MPRPMRYTALSEAIVGLRDVDMMPSIIDRRRTSWVMSLSHIAGQTADLICWPKRDGHFASLEATEHVFCAWSEKTGVRSSGFY
jgi:hypothetical protein